MPADRPFCPPTFAEGLHRPYWRFRSPPPLAGGGRARPRGVNEKPARPPLLGAGYLGGGREGSVAWRRAGVLLPNLPPHPSPAWGEETPFASLTPLRGEPSPLLLVSVKKEGEAKGRSEGGGCPPPSPPGFALAGSPHHLTGGGWAPPPPGGAPRGSPPSSRR